MPYPNEMSCRIHPPGGYQKDSFRRIKRGKLSMVIAKRPGKDTTEVQAFRYPISDWTEDAAKKHCKDQGGAFEAAAPKKKSVDTTVKDYLVSRIHQSFTVAADQLYGLGIIKEQDERIAISSAIGEALTQFTEQFDKTVENKVIPADIVKQMMEQGWMDKLKEISADELLELAEQNPKLADFELIEKALGEGQGVGGPKQGVGGTDTCVCPECSEEVEHERGTPCTEVECPECGVVMEGKEKQLEEERVVEEKAMEKETAPTPSKFYSLKTRDGRDCWVALSGSSYEDREGEIIARKAIDFGIAHGDETGQRGELRLYHYPGSKVGECTFQYRRGNFLVEAGLWDDTVRARKAKEWVAGRDPDEVGVSVGFFYNPKKFKRDKALDAMVYEDEVIFFERSILKRKHASCPWATVSTIQGGLKAMSNKEDLVEMVGEGETKAILEGVDEKAKDLEEQKVAFKEDQEKAQGEGLLEQVKALSEDDLKALYALAGKLLKVEEKEVEEKEVEEEVVEEKQVEAPEEVQFRLDDAAIKAIAEAVKEMLPDNSKLEAEITALKEAAELASKVLTEQVETKVKEVFEDLPKGSIYRATKVTEEEPKEEPKTTWVNPLERDLEDGIREIEKAREAGR